MVKKAISRYCPFNGCILKSQWSMHVIKRWIRNNNHFLLSLSPLYLGLIAENYIYTINELGPTLLCHTCTRQIKENV
jgi:hypothetical protein